jgi:serine/threonine protein kinase
MELLSLEDAGVDLQEKLGAGSFGLVRLGILRATKEKVAVKLEPQTADRPMLDHEAMVMRQLRGKQGIPDILSVGRTEGWNYIVMQLLGGSLWSKWRACGDHFSLSTLLGCAEQMTIALSAVHGAQYVHRDIKPENFLVGRGSLSTSIYLIDFGLAKRFNERSVFSSHLWNHQVTGTLPFVSLNVHAGVNPAMRDDLESLAYVLIYFLVGGLPWHGIGRDICEERAIRLMKESAEPIGLCAGQPEEFGLLLKYARSLKFEETPDYAFVLSLFRTVATRLSLSLVIVPDWESRKRRKRQSAALELSSILPQEEQPAMILTQESTIHRSRSLPREPTKSLPRVKTREKLFIGFSDRRTEIMLRAQGPVKGDSPANDPPKKSPSDPCTLF